MHKAEISSHDLSVTLICFTGSMLAIIINYFLNIDPYHILFFIFGSLLYMLHSTISITAFNSESEYIQTGEAVAGSMLIVLFDKVLAQNPAMTIAASAAAAAIFITILNKMTDPSSKDSTFAGAMLNGAAALSVIYLAGRDMVFSPNVIKKVLSGHVLYSSNGAYAAAVIAGIIALLYISIIKIFPLITVFSHGNFFSGPASQRAKWIYPALMLHKSISLILMLYLTGFMGAVSFYTFKAFYRNKKNLGAAFQFIFPMQVLLPVVIFAGPYLPAGIAIALSYLAYAAYKFIRTGIYDRGGQYRL